ncbi:hypothetical protein [Paenibacillus harenae]|uniref:hypothetical protein n=1 Tax=Paenibacillus harenae TaxID=306543 RepID=UPI00278D6F0D|nr:hypothetical protein [Paenibacillus harenae]MDQ0060063.1 hypothetical protein [Paenibacillus harenae]
MSEFSESYHLFSKDQKEGVDLLNRAGIGGFVYPEENNWVTLLPEGEIFHENNKLISNNTGTLLHYIFAEDHGWLLSIFENNTMTFHYECNWDTDVENNYKEIDKNKLIELINRNREEHNRITVFEISKLLNINSMEDIFEFVPAYQVAELIGLKHYEWLSYDNMVRDIDDLKESDPNFVKGLIIVSK